MTEAYAREIEQHAIDRIPPAGPRGRSRRTFTAKLTAVLAADGWPTIAPQRTPGGTCHTCGEDGRCPGVHIDTMALERPSFNYQTLRGNEARDAR